MKEAILLVSGQGFGHGLVKLFESLRMVVSQSEGHIVTLTLVKINFKNMLLHFFI
jgi:hypothetical protein